VLPGYADADVQARVTQYLTAGGLTAAATVSVGPTESVAIAGQCISLRPVTVGYPHDFMFVGAIIGFFGGPSLASRTLHATASMRSEIAAGACP